MINKRENISNYSDIVGSDRNETKDLYNNVFEKFEFNFFLKIRNVYK